MPPQECELYWAAGFMEGEGSFGFHPGDGTLFINAAQKEAEPLERLQRFLGGKIYAPGKQPIHRWCLHGQGAITKAMRDLYPLLSTRRQGQIDSALERRAAYAGSAEQRRRNAARERVAASRRRSDPEFRDRRYKQHAEWETRNAAHRNEWRKQWRIRSLLENPA